MPLRTFQNGSEWFRMVQNGSEWFRMVQNEFRMEFRMEISRSKKKLCKTALGFGLPPSELTFSQPWHWRITFPRTLTNRFLYVPLTHTVLFRGTKAYPSYCSCISISRCLVSSELVFEGNLRLPQGSPLERVSRWEHSNRGLVCHLCAYDHRLHGPSHELFVSKDLSNG